MPILHVTLCHPQANAVTSALLAPLRPVSDIHVHQVKAGAFGYAGPTQEHRFITADWAVP